MKPGMMKRKAAADRQKVVDHVANNVEAAKKAGVLEHKLANVSLSNIQLWQEQPRAFLLTMEDIYAGTVKADDKDRIQKQEELEGIISLAISQQLHGMVNPPVAYEKPGQAVQLIGGQRRTMAAIFAAFHLDMESGEPMVEVNPNPDLKLLESIKIAVKVYLRKPDARTLKRIGIIDNTQRINLPTSDKLRWALDYADDIESTGEEVDHIDLVDSLGLSRSQGFEWLRVIKTRKDRWVAKVVDMALINKATFKQLQDISSADADKREDLYESWFGISPSTDSVRISLGVSSNLTAIQRLVLANIDRKDRAVFEEIDWSNPKKAKKGFAEFLRYWEAKHE